MKEFVVEATKDIGVLMEGTFHYWSTSKRKVKKLFAAEYKGWKVLRIKNGINGSSL